MVEHDKLTYMNRQLMERLFDWKLTEQDRKYIAKLIRRDIPGHIGQYYGATDDGLRRRLLKCDKCGRNIRMLSPKRPIRENRFCPMCGQRLDWETRIKEEGMEIPLE